MTIENEQITPADAAIVSSGTGTKGPEERDLPASLKEEMDLCLQILREVLGEFDEKLLAKFDEVREHALNASAERFSGILTDTNPNQDDLQKVVDIIDGGWIGNNHIQFEIWSIVAGHANMIGSGHTICLATLAR